MIVALLRIWPFNLPWCLFSGLAIGLGYAGLISIRVYDLLIFIADASILWRAWPVVYVLGRPVWNWLFNK
jgi:hypothetical protein